GLGGRDRRLGIEVDLDQISRVARGAGGIGHDGHDRVANRGHPTACEWWEGWNPGEWQWKSGHIADLWDIVGGRYRHYSRVGAGGLDVQPRETRARVGRSHKRQVQHALRLHIFDVASLASQKPWVLDATNRLAGCACQLVRPGHARQGSPLL